MILLYLNSHDMDLRPNYNTTNTRKVLCTLFFSFEHLESSHGTVVLTAVRLHVRCKGGKEKGGLM